MTGQFKDKQITVVGCGYVGVTTAAVLANCGHTVQAIERNPARLEVLRSGISFFYEAGVDPLLKQAIDAGTLTFGSELTEAAVTSDLIFSCVGTPDNPDGSSNLSYVESVAAICAGLMKPGSLFVQKSTVPVGTGKRLQDGFKKRGVSYVSNPEFLREATAISDTLYLDRAVAGSDEPAAAERVLNIYRGISRRRAKLAKMAGITPPSEPPKPRYLAASLASAELIKVTANAFLALKISFANSIAQLADASGADIVQVMDAVGADPRIGRAFLNAGRGYGGGCFPKDVSGLIRSAADWNVDLGIMRAASQVNDAMADYVIARSEKAYGKPFTGRRVAVLGLAFKAGTSDVRRSSAIDIANLLTDRGADVAAFDPEANQEAAEHLRPGTRLLASAEEAASGAECLFIATDWPEFTASIDTLIRQSGTTLVVDCMNALDPAAVTAAGARYVGVGRNVRTDYT